MTTDVAITFDIEFDINGTFNAPATRMPRGSEAFYCSGNPQTSAGLDRILDCLGDHDIRATFFVEALQTAWFGMAEMGDIAHKIRDHGHELQLHLHPVWLQFDDKDWRGRTAGNPPRSEVHDSLIALTAERATALVTRGLDVFRQWELPQPTAIRTGSLMIERSLYPVFHSCGLKISSSVGLGLYRPRDPNLQLFTTAGVFDGVTELPVSSYDGADPLLRRRQRLATLIGMGMREQRSLLETAKATGTPFVVILSHVSEFLSLDSSGARRPNALTNRKFELLCRSIKLDPGLSAATIEELARRVDSTAEMCDTRLSVSRVASALRFPERLFN